MPIAVNDQTGEVLSLDPSGEWVKARTAVNPQTKEMLVLDGTEWKPVPTKSKGVLGYIDDAARAIAQGVTFGYADEIGARVNPAINRALGLDAPETTEAALAQERARDEQIPAAIKYPGEIAGAVGATVLAAPAVAAGAARAGLTALPRAAQFAGLGAAEGALAGSGHSVEGERVKGAATGAAIGAPVGAAAPAVASGVAGLVNRIKNAFSTQANVAADVGRAIVRDETTPQDLARAASEATATRPGVASIADAGGENVRGLVERVAQTPGAGRTKVVPRLTQRQREQTSRVGRDLRHLTGTRRTALQATQETMAERATAARPLYQEAMEFDARQSPEIVAAWRAATETGFGKQLLNSKNVKHALQTEYGIQNVENAPLMVLIDAWKKNGVDDAITAAKKAGKNNTARVLTNMKNRVLAVVDEANPVYKEARDAWSDPSSYLDAIESGRGILNRNMSAEEMKGAFDALSAAEQEAFRTGAVSAILARIGNNTAKIPDVTTVLRSPEMREKIAAIMPTEEAAEEWAKRLEFEIESSELTRQALGNSATARRLAEQADAQGVVVDLAIDALMGSPGGASVLSRFFTAGPRWARDTLRSKADNELGDLLTNPDRVDDLQGVLARIAAANQPVSGRTNAALTAAGVTGLTP